MKPAVTFLATDDSPKDLPVTNYANFLKAYLFTLGKSARLLTTGSTSASGRANLRRTSALLGHQGGEGTLPVQGMEVFGPNSDAVEVREVEALDYNVSPLELVGLCRLAKWLAPKTIFEIGTFDGRSLVNLLSNAPDDATAWTLDLPPQEQQLGGVKVGGRVEACGLSSRVEQLYGDSTRFDFAPYSGRCDLIFIDADHSYEGCHNDTRKALPMLKSGGAIAWHDYSPLFPGVVRAVDELQASGRAPGRMLRLRNTSLALCLPQAA